MIRSKHKSLGIPYRLVRFDFMLPLFRILPWQSEQKLDSWQR